MSETTDTDETRTTRIFLRIGRDHIASVSEDEWEAGTDLDAVWDHERPYYDRAIEVTVTRPPELPDGMESAASVIVPGPSDGECGIHDAATVTATAGHSGG